MKSLRKQAQITDANVQDLQEASPPPKHGFSSFTPHVPWHSDWHSRCRFCSLHSGSERVWERWSGCLPPVVSQKGLQTSSYASGCLSVTEHCLKQLCLLSLTPLFSVFCVGEVHPSAFPCLMCLLFCCFFSRRTWDLTPMSAERPRQARCTRKNPARSPMAWAWSPARTISSSSSLQTRRTTPSSPTNAAKGRRNTTRRNAQG